VFDEAGLDAIRAAEIRAKGGAFGPASVPSALEWISRLRSQGVEARVIVETTTLDIRSGEPATAHVRAGFAAGAHVITANKGPVAFAYRALRDEAASAGLAFRFEGAVMDGLPIFNLVQETLPAVSIRGFRGVLNSTTNFILSALERGEPFGPALDRMQKAGVAEADPSLDVDGWDAAAKTAALVNVLMGGVITPHHVSRTGIRDVTGVDVREALGRNKRIRLVASASRLGGKIKARVEPELLDQLDPLAGMVDLNNALYLTTDLLGEIGIVQRGGDLTQTAYALLSDLSRISLRLKDI